MSKTTEPFGVSDRPTDEGHIQVGNLRKTFASGSVVAAEDINLTFGKDEFIVLLGPSGCGKTTTLRCIAGLEEPNTGHVTIGGEEVTYRKPKDRNLAFVFQSIALFPHMTVRENIRFGLDMKTDLSSKEKGERVEEAAETLGIEPMLDRKPKALSGGQQQRVSIGRAMVMEPDAFLLDEPFSALDANLRDTMRVEIKKLQRKLETTMIFVTHDQEEAMTLGDRIVVMDNGRVQQIGTPHEIYNEPANRFIAQFIGSPSTNIIECTITGRSDGELVLESDLFELPLPADRAETLAGKEGESVELGIRPEHLNIGRDGLFDAEITVVEPHGPNDAIYLQTGDRELTATTLQGEVDPEESPVSVDFDREEIWIFDLDGTRLL